MTILGIETSCDDTGVAVLKTTPQKNGVKFNILSNVVSSQIKVHQKYGGVVPNLAAREHLKNIEPCLRQALKQANIPINKIDLIAITAGPGLIPSLLVGVNFAKTLAYKYKIPIVGINHIEAHVIAALATTSSKFPRSSDRVPRQMTGQILFPAIALTVSGGHTQLILVKKIGDYKIIGETRDDAAGECFDKVAKLLQLGYPGGPVIAKMAEKFKTNTKYKIPDTKYQIQLPRPMIYHKNYDFSFSGLKTAVLYTVKNQKSKTKNQNFIQNLCKETQQAIIDVLINKTMRAAKEYKAKTIILAGGVAANKELRQQLQATSYKLQASPTDGQAKFLTPVKNLCTDNGAMIAIAGYFNKNKASKNYNRIKANANLRLS